MVSSTLPLYARIRRQERAALYLRTTEVDASSMRA